jgi:hypothetical protein
LPNVLVLLLIALLTHVGGGVLLQRRLTDYA